MPTIEPRRSMDEDLTSSCPAFVITPIPVRSPSTSFVTTAIFRNTNQSDFKPCAVTELSYCFIKCQGFQHCESRWLPAIIRAGVSNGDYTTGRD
jgi:hypothetical protein